MRVSNLFVLAYLIPISICINSQDAGPIKDARGNSFPIGRKYNRIVSLAPGTTELLYAIGAGPKVVADTTYCNFPPAALKLPKIGDVNTSVEKTLAIHPDIVIASASANRSAIPLLEKADLKIYAMDPISISDVSLEMTRLGKLLGCEQSSNACRAMFDSRLKKLASVVKHVTKVPTVLAVVQYDPLMVVGPNNFMNDLIQLAGAKNAASALQKPWSEISPEQLVAINPDIIIASKSVHDRIARRAGWSNINAVRDHRLIELPGDEAVRPGPRLLNALENLIRQIHPELSSKLK